MTDQPSQELNSEAETALRLHVGDPTYERGAAHYRHGRVAELKITSKRTTAVVTAEDRHEVEVRRTPRGFEGHCSCAQSDGFDFCEHCVAVALALDARETQRAAAQAGAPEARLQLYLDDLPREKLIEVVANAARDLPDLNERLQLHADIAAGAMNVRRARKMVTAAMPLRQIWQRPLVRRYFAKAVTAMNGLLQVAPAMEPATLINVAEYALDRYESVLERVDDSDGNRWFLQDRLRALLAVALAHVDWSVERKADYLLDRVLREQYDLFDKGMSEFWQVLEPRVRAVFFDRAGRRLDALVDGTSEDELFGLHRTVLVELLRTDATQRDDVDALIALEKANLRGSLDRYRLAGLYLRKPDLDAALQMLDEADARAHSGHYDHALRVAIHRARCEWDDAVAAQVRVVLAAPSLPAYRDLQALVKNTGSSAKTLRNLHAALRGQLNTGSPGRSQSAELLAELAFESGDADGAFALVVEHVSDAKRLLEMARWFETDEPVRATQLIDCAVEATIAQKKNWAYKETVSIIWSQRATFDRLGPQVFASFVADLKVRHKAKRNLVALLEAAASE
ncbi:MAG: SWIM zinc finger domain-containing protein [Gammaproteobacteria bacterium]